MLTQQSNALPPPPKKKIGFCKKSWKEQVKYFKCCEKFQILLEILRKYLSGNWHYCSYFLALPTVSSFCFVSLYLRLHLFVFVLFS